MAILALWCDRSIAQTETAFSPHQGATELVVQTIDTAKHSIRLVAYTFTAPTIADALITSHQRGIDVQIVLDEKASHQKSSLVDYLIAAGLPVRLDSRHAITHDKFIVVDDAAVETGSFNYTKAAESRNAENVVMIHDPKVAQDYTAQWQRLWEESEPINPGNEEMK